MKDSRIILALLALSTGLLCSANAQASSCRSAGADHSNCQWEQNVGGGFAATTSTTVPSSSGDFGVDCTSVLCSDGIRLDRRDQGGQHLRNIFFFHHFHKSQPQTCVVINNDSSHDIFVPQATEAEFSAFLNNLPAGITASSCVQGQTITATASFGGGYEIFATGGPAVTPSTGYAKPTTQAIALPALNSSATSSSSVTETATFTYTREDCLPGATSLSMCKANSIVETQAITVPINPSTCASGAAVTASCEASYGTPTVVSAFTVNGAAAPSGLADYNPPALLACGSTPSGSTVTGTVSASSGSIAATAAQCPNGGTQATKTTVTQVQLCTNGTLANQGAAVTTTVNSGSPVCNAQTTTATACGSTPNGSTATETVSTTSGSIAATTAQCANGGTQPTKTTVTQVQLCTNGTLTNQGAQVSTTVNNGSPTCNAAAAVSGKCGSANEAIFSSAPTTNLCSTGKATVVSGTGPFNWSCTGSNGGTTDSCSAGLAAATPVNGACGASTGACSTGSAVNVTNSGGGPASWSCAGSNGGTTASCSTDSPPAQAVAAGYTTPVLLDDFTSDTINGPGFGGSHPNWFTNIPYGITPLTSSQYQIGNGKFVIDTDNSGFGEGVSTHNYANGGTPALSTPGAIQAANANGIVFKYGYFEWTFSFNPDGYSGTGNVPAFWTSYSGAGPTDSNGDYSEIDFFEAWPVNMNWNTCGRCGPVGSTPNPAVGSSSVLEWTPGSSSGNGVSSTNIGQLNFGTTNTLGYLWTSSGVKVYWNNVLIGTNPISSSNGGASQIDFNDLIIGTGYNWPLTTYSVHVWQ